MERLKTNPHLAVIPIIVVSAPTGLLNQECTVKARVKAHLPKPVDDDEPMAVSQMILGGPARATGASGPVGIYTAQGVVMESSSFPNSEREWKQSWV
jgi:hypothetical protein